MCDTGSLYMYFKIGGLEAEIFTRNHKSIPIYNYTVTGWPLNYNGLSITILGNTSDT